MARAPLRLAAALALGACACSGPVEPRSSLTELRATFPSVRTTWLATGATPEATKRGYRLKRTLVGFQPRAGFALDEVGATLQVTPHFVTAESWSEQDGHLVAAQGGPVDAYLIHETPSGVEGVIHVRHADVDSLAYTVTPDGFHGVRHVGQTVEFLDAAGFPRLRMIARQLVDSRGVRRDLRLHVTGCEVDRDGRRPWTRPVLALLSPSCQIRVSWDRANLSYPVLVDPEWGAATGMRGPRVGHTATRLPDGDVMLIGGASRNDGMGNLTPGQDLSAEFFSAAAQVWSSGAAQPPDNRRGHTVVEVTRGGDVNYLVLGGFEHTLGTPTAALSDPVLYDVTTDTWTAEPHVDAPSGYVPAARLPDGGSDRYLLGNWGAPPLTLNAAGTDFTFRLGCGTTPGQVITSHPEGALLTGGSSAQAPGFAAAYLYRISDTTCDKDAMGSLNDRRREHRVVPLAGGRYQLFSGQLCSGATCGPTTGSEVYEPDMDAWRPGPEIPIPVVEPLVIEVAHGATRSHLVLGGRAPLPSDLTFWLRDDGESVPGPTLKSARVDAAAAVFGDPPAGIIVSGGSRQITSFPEARSSAEQLVFAGLGVPCGYDAECRSGFCVDGVCCDEACDGACRACAASLQDVPAEDGTCGDAAVGQPDPRDGCAVDQNACGNTGRCAAGAQCAIAAAGTDCGVPSCSTDGTSRSFPECDGAGACAERLASCAPYLCVGDACTNECDGDADCQAPAVCDTKNRTCIGVAQCDGSIVTSAGGDETDCAPYVCEASGVCKSSCATTADCVAPRVCDSNNRCVDASGGASPNDGCGCRTRGRRSTSRLWGPLALLLAAGWRRRGAGGATCR